MLAFSITYDSACYNFAVIISARSKLETIMVWTATRTNKPVVCLNDMTLHCDNAVRTEPNIRQFSWSDCNGYVDHLCLVGLITKVCCLLCLFEIIHLSSPIYCVLMVMLPSGLVGGKILSGKLLKRCRATARVIVTNPV